MIWIVTLCLLFVAAWLFFNAMNEREWVQAHIHDDLVAADKGLFPGLTGAASGLTASAGDGKLGSALDRAVGTVKEKSAELGSKAKDATHVASEKAREVAEKSGDKLSDMKSAAKNKVDSANKNIGS